MTTIRAFIIAAICLLPGLGMANTPPTIKISMPAVNSTFIAPASITLLAYAADSDGAIGKVHFHSGGTLIGTGLPVPGGGYTLNWGKVPAGSYSLTATAYDMQGASATTPPVAITVNSPANLPPSVSLTAPAAGSSHTAPASITLAASAADSDGSIASLAFYNGATLIGTGTLAGGSYTHTWSNVAAGSYSLTARAVDNQGAPAESPPVNITVTAPANVAPSVSMTGPADGAIYTAPAAITLTATAADSDGTIAKVEFYNGATLVGTDTSSPYSLSLSNVAAGSYAYTARAYDNTGATTNSTAVNVIVAAANVAPKVNMTGPAGGSTYAAPASVMLTAEAADSDGSIAAVEFYNGTTPIGSATTPPYATTWSNVPAGNYSVRARAVDDRGGATYSNTIAVNVNAVVASSVHYVYADHLNTPRVITDASNKVVWRWDSDPFGADAANEDPDGDGQKFRYNLRFPGQYYDRETGLHYNYFRDYEPGTGRYVQADPIGLAGRLNLYAYVGGNPVGYVDPLGLKAVPCGDGTPGCDDGLGDPGAKPRCVTVECLAGLPPIKQDNRTLCEIDKGLCKLVCKMISTPLWTGANYLASGGFLGTIAGYFVKKEACEIVCN